MWGYIKLFPVGRVNKVLVRINYYDASQEKNLALCRLESLN